MPYYSDNWTDKELEALERQIAEVFKEAEKDLDKEVKEYFAKFKLRDKEMKDLVDAGEMTEAAYQQWRLTRLAEDNALKPCGIRWRKDIHRRMKLQTPM